MNKKLMTLSVLSVIGAASSLAVAATSVDLYGTVNVAYQKKGDAKIVMAAQDYQYASKIGFKGREDLGNGYAAIFRLEAQLNPDVGSGTYGSTGTEFGFNRESWVGLITPFGAMRVGRSTAPLVNMWIGGGFDVGRGIGEFTGGLVGAGLRTTHPEAASRWNNAFFYDIKKDGFAAGASITTKGSQSSVPTGFFTSGLPLTDDYLNTSIDNEGADGSKVAWGAYARYEGSIGRHGYKVGAAYQRDNGSSYSSNLTSTNAPAEAQDAYALAAGYSFGPVGLSLGYAKSNIDNSSLPFFQVDKAPIAYALRTATSKTLFAAVNYEITSNDKVYFSYGNYERDNNYAFPTAAAVSTGQIEGTQYSVGYEHALSKRTVVYANARKVGSITNTCSNTGAVCAAAVARVNAILDTEKDYSYDIGFSHSF